jgi:YHS domain-containing protein
MFRYIFEFLTALILFAAVRTVLSSIVRALSSGGSIPNPAYRAPSSAPETGEANMRNSGQLRQDPVCGTYVATNTPFTEIERDQTTYFCSWECRETYRRQSRAGSQWRKPTAARS